MFRQNKLRVNRGASRNPRVGTHFLLELLERRRLCSNTPILVTRADDSSVAPVAGMLRYAIQTANSTIGADTIVFNIGGINSGAHSITPVAPLPAITDTLFIDGWSQGGNAYAGPPQIRLDGASAGSGPTVGLRFQDVANCTTRGLSITGWNHGVEFDNSGTLGIGNNTFTGNYVGLRTSGVVPAPNVTYGVYVLNSNNNAFSNNVISGNGGPGLYVNHGLGNVFTGNYIGTDPTGTVAIGNSGAGIYLAGGSQSNRIGTNGDGVNDAAEGNVISNNGLEGIAIADSGSSNNSIAGNKIGTDLTGTVSMPNRNPGVRIYNGASNNLIGGSSAIFGNLIALNTPTGAGINAQPGVVVQDAGSVGNTIRANSIYGNNGIGIDLGWDGVTLNNDRNVDVGPNHLQNYPVILSATSGPAATVGGTFNSLPNAACTLDFYASSSPNLSQFGDGQRWLGSAAITTDASGNATFNLSLSAATASGEWITATATDPNGNTSEFSQARPANTAPIALSSAAWTALGPAPLSVLGDGVVVSGRISWAVADPTNINTLYVAADGGGVWKTTDWLDPSPVWTPLTDNLSSLSFTNISYKGLVVYPGNSQILYAALAGPGGGVFKSINGGNTWTLPSGAFFDTATFSSLLISPTDSNLLYASVWFANGIPGGVYKSTNGGVNWANTTTSIPFFNSASDIVMDPTNPLILYAGLVGGLTGNGLYKSINGGSSWSRQVTFPTGTAIGSSIRLAIAPSSPLTLYATYFDSTDTSLPHRYSTTNGGTNWTLLPDIADPETRYWHAALAVDPTHPLTVYINGNHDLYRSTNGGVNWTLIQEHPNANNFFDDPVNVTFDSAGGVVLLGDRGIYRSVDGLGNYANKQGNLQTNEFHTLTLDPNNPNIIYGVSQDHGALLKGFGAPVWNYTKGGFETGKVLVSPTDSSRLFVYTPTGDSGPPVTMISRSDDGGATWVNAGAGIPTAIGGFPLGYASQKSFQMDPANPHRLVVGTTQVYETTNDGNSWVSLNPGGDLSPGHYISGLAIAASNPNTLYAATDDGKFWVTTDDGGSWTENDVTTPDPFNYVVDLKVDPANSLHVFAITAAFRTGYNSNQHIWTTTNGGSTWTNITGTLPTKYWPQSLAVDWRFASPQLYVGTASGVYQSTLVNGAGTVWTPFGANLPHAVTEDLQLLPNSNLLAAATYGRGVYEILIGTPAAVTIISGSTVLIKKNVDNLHADVTANGAVTQWTIGQLSTLSVTGGAGNDTLTLDFSNGNPLPAGGISFDGGGGVNTLNVIGTSGSDALAANPTRLTFTGGTFSNIPINAANVQAIQFHGGSGGSDTINLISGSYMVDADTAIGTPNVSITVQAAANATFATDQHLANLTLNGGNASIVAATRKTLFVNTLTVTSNGLLDIGKNFVYLDNTLTPTLVTRNYLKNGYNADITGIGNWLGRGGITSSDAILSHNVTNDFHVSVGYVDGADVAALSGGTGLPGNPTGPQPPVIPANRTLVRAALYGDLNFDGVVDDVDLQILSGIGAYGAPSTPYGWLTGDFNHDGKVDDVDLQIFSGAGNYGSGLRYAPAGAQVGSIALSGLHLSAAKSVSTPVHAQIFNEPVLTRQTMSKRIESSPRRLHQNYRLRSRSSRLFTILARISHR